MATSCSHFAIVGMGQECAGSAAGLKRLMIGLAREWTLTPSTGGTHTATLSGSSTAATFYEYYITDESTSLTSTLNVNNANGVRYYSNVINATFIRMRPEKHLELMALANEKLVILAQDNNGQYWAFDNASATAETAQSGQSFDDMSGYQIEISGRNSALPYGIDSGSLPKIDTPNVYE